jgi:PUA domain protein
VLLSIHDRPANTDARFNPKEDVSGSTSLKSSVQRNIRNQLLAQLPLLSAPAFKEGGAVSAPAPAAAPVEEAPPAPASTQDEDEGKGKGGKKGGGGKTKGGGKKGGKKQQAQAAADEDEHDDEGDVTVLDEIWPKKDSIGLTKW